MSKPETDTLTDQLVTGVRDLLSGNSVELRAEAARNLGRTHSKIAAWYLIEVLSDPAPEVRLAAVEALGEIGDPAAIEPLSKLLDSETLIDRSIILRAMDRLRQFGSDPVPSFAETTLTQ